MRKIVFLRGITAAAVSAMACTCSLVFAQALVPKQDARKGSWGYVKEGSPESKWAVKPQYEKAEELREMPNGKKRAFVTRKGAQGLIDESGKVLGAGVVFEAIEPMEGDAMLITVKGKRGVANYDGVYLVKPEIEAMEQLNDEGMLVLIKGKKGLLGHDGKFILQPIYKDIDTHLADYFIVDLDGKAGLLSRDATQILIEPKEFTGLSPFGGYWKVRDGDKTGLYNLDKHLLMLKPDYYDVAQPIPFGYITAYPVCDKSGAWGVVDSTGKEIVKQKYAEILPILKASALVLRENVQFNEVMIAGAKKPFKVLEFRTTRTGPFEEITVDYKAEKKHTKSFRGLKLPNGTIYEGTGGRPKSLNGLYYVDFDWQLPLYDASGKVIVEKPGVMPVDYEGWTLLNDRAVSPSKEIYPMEKRGDYFLVADAAGKKHFLLGADGISDYTVDDIKELNLLTQNNIKGVKSGGKWALFDGLKPLLPFDYESIVIKDNEKSLLEVTKDGKFGVYNVAARKWDREPVYDLTELADMDAQAAAQKAIQDDYMTGYNFYYGFDCTRNLDKAFAGFKKAADQGYAPAIVMLGDMYWNGQSVPENKATAFQYYTKAADMGYFGGKYNVAYCYEEGKGAKKDKAKATQLFKAALPEIEKAANAGDMWAQYYLGDMYYWGYGVTKNYEEAAKWYKKAYEQGSVLATRRLGYLYYAGEGVDKNSSESMKCNKYAAEHGDPVSQNNYGLDCNRNYNYTEAAKWYRLSAEQGYVDGMAHYGYCFLEGQGVRQDYTEAVKWLTKAAEKGDEYGQLNLGYCYYYGYGVPKNRQKANYWYKKSAAQGNQTAKENLRKNGVKGY